ncbi:PPE domain-containing protein [Amycolatopsis sp. OK19-0408]|uniref:PPE domain-containing protein n=1 Tax=Amycolatopsis iheyensis TaxID=2945988 RepID=A0A9X2NA20_9PSEU|nr:PPE domain-containing protein [Amycolatopsis iheyensis]MCR6483748.1 PPE domain-containing protein [Amycolatopsis iheyensis]
MPEFHSTHHRPTARERAKAKRVRREKAANSREAAFGRIHWDSYDHRELWDMIHSAETRKLGAQAHQWGELAQGVDTATGDVHALVQKLLLSWRGPSAAQAADSVQRLTGWASTAGENAWHIGDGLHTYTSAIDEAQKRMPEPVHYWAERWFQEGYAVKRLDGPEGTYMLDELLDDKLPTKKQADQAKAAAVRVMEQYESASHDVRHRLPPAFDAAPQVSAPNSDVVVPREPRPPVTPVVPHDPEPPVGNEPGQGPDDSTSTASALLPTFTGAGLPGGLDGVIGAGTSSGPGGGFGGVAGVPGAAASGSGTLGEGGRAGTGRFGTSAAGFGPGASAGRGSGAGYGMYPPGQGARREEDTEHRDKYANGYDLLDDLPPAYPPVFGE